MSVGRIVAPPKLASTIPVIRCHVEQRGMFDALGGALWLRAALDAHLETHYVTADGGLRLRKKDKPGIKGGTP